LGVKTRVFSERLAAQANLPMTQIMAVKSAPKAGWLDIKRLTIRYGGRRQAGIPSELLEVVCGAEALK